MINVKSKKCIYEGCNTQPSFNMEGETNALYCAIHKKEKMIDIKSKKCIYDGCKTIPVFNVEGEINALYCAIHKKEKMIDIKNKRCIYEECKIIPTFNFEGKTTALYCTAHKKEGMIDVKSRTCKSKWCLTHIQNEKYEGYCIFCFIHTFPDKPVSRNYKTKEKEVVDNIIKIFPQFSWISDKKVKDGCSKRRPDLLLDMGDYVIIVEVDENKHNQYDCSCENKRLMELSQDLQHRPIIFIRFNPDDYINNNGIKIKSCWSLNKFGIMHITKEKIIEWNKRINILTDQIQYWIDHKPYKTIEIVELFY